MPLPKLWKTRDGRVIPIKDMTDSHLVNTLAMLRRNVSVVRFRLELETLRRLESTLCALQGEMAIDCAEREIDAFVDAMAEQSNEDWLKEQAIFRALRNEAKRRGINGKSVSRGGWVRGDAQSEVVQ